MKILVCISNVPDTTTKITFTDNNTQFNTNGVQFILNPYDEIALSRAIELTEGSGGSASGLQLAEEVHRSSKSEFAGRSVSSFVGLAGR